MERLCHLPAENGENYYLLTKQDERESYDMELFLTDGCDVWEKYGKYVINIENKILILLILISEIKLVL